MIKRIVGFFGYVEVFVRAKLVEIGLSYCAQTEELHRQENLVTSHSVLTTQSCKTETIKYNTRSNVEIVCFYPNG